jgi:hypothetical protein
MGWQEEEEMSVAALEDAPSIPLVIREPSPPAEVARFLVERAVQLHTRGSQEEQAYLPWLLEHPEAPESVLLDFCDRGLFLDDLGHRPGPRRLLERLAAKHRYPEAILTLGKQLYTDPAEPVSALRAFLTEHRDSPWLFTSLAHQEARPPEKEAVLLDLAANLPVGEEVQTIRAVRRQETRASVASDPAEIEQLYRLREPAVWRALAGNPQTPVHLLQELSEVKTVKYAREIRRLAQANLARSSHP